MIEADALSEARYGYVSPTKVHLTNGYVSSHAKTTSEMDRYIWYMLLRHI